MAERLAPFGGRLQFREESYDPESGRVCLTFEFPELEQAKAAADALRHESEHVEGPVDYGP